MYRHVAWERIDVTTGYGAATVEWGRDAPDGADVGWIDAVEFVAERRRNWGLRLALGIDEQWRCDFALVVPLTRQPRQSLTLERTGDAQWVVNGRRRRALDGCVELDVAATPLTNTFAIRALALKVGEERTIRVAWVDVPSLRVTAVEQGYRRIGLVDGSSYLEAFDFWSVGGRTYRLTVDSDDLVVAYQDFARRMT